MVFKHVIGFHCWMPLMNLWILDFGVEADNIFCFSFTFSLHIPEVLVAKIPGFERLFLINDLSTWDEKFGLSILFS